MQDQEVAVKKVRVWDLPLRLFHWALAILVVISFITIKVGGEAMDWHMRSGYAILALLVFRLVWGFVGGDNARFARFIRGPRTIFRYLGEQFGSLPSSVHMGHNPVGALSVVALLGILLFQSVSGLFANDDIFTEGPLAKLITKETSDAITGWHKGAEWWIIGLVALHLLAILFYRVVKKERLVGAMISGRKQVPAAVAVEDARGGHALLGLGILAMAAALVWYIVTQV